MAEELAQHLWGWFGYFRRSQTPSVLQSLEECTRRRLRSAIWKQWRHGMVWFVELRKRGGNLHLAAATAGSAHGSWHFARSNALAVALPDACFDSLGVPRLPVRELPEPPNRRMRTRMAGGVARNTDDSLPMSISTTMRFLAISNDWSASALRFAALGGMPCSGGASGTGCPGST
jgi:hypothetical protein